ncbi:MAG: DUF2062 domain-containing protein [Desulfuromonadales bacterium]|nr:DUF2062 domain-containing protein [Desulfuromonadales bacterium]
MTERSDNRWQRFGFFRRFKLNLIRLARIKSSPDAVARGMALGVFIGFTPFFGFHILIALFFAFLLQQNKIATFVGVWITNPLTAPFIYALEYEIGRMLLGKPAIGVAAFTRELTWDTALQLGLPLGLGSIVLGLPVALISYALTLRLMPWLRQYRIPRWPKRLRKLLPGDNRNEMP